MAIRSAEPPLHTPDGSSYRSDPGASVADLVGSRSGTSSEHVYLRSVDGARAVTYGELRRIATRWSARLAQLGVEPGETVGLALSDPMELSAVFVAALAAGRTLAPLDPAATDRELVAACTRTAPKIVLSDRRAPYGNRTEWITTPPGEGSLSGTYPADALDTVDAVDAVDVTGALPPAASTGGVVLTTSGTTGAPKVICLDQVQLLHTARAVAEHFEISADDRGFNALPLFHINAEVVGLLATLVSGSTLVLADRFHRRGFWAAMARHRVTWINAVPAILARLSHLEEGETVPAGIRFARSASAPLPVPVLERFERATRIPVVETYGMTEAASQITANPLGNGRKPGSVGRPVGTELRVVTGDGLSARHGEVGRVVIRGPSVIRAYRSAGYEDRVDADGWLGTGDLGYLDDAGFLFLVGRADDVINRGGEKVYPKEVEDVVLGDRQVRSAVVVGREDEVLGTVPVAYLVADGVQGGDDEALAAAVAQRVHDRCRRLLSRQKLPVTYHFVVALPQGATGKVRRSALAGTPTVFSYSVR